MKVLNNVAAIACAVFSFGCIVLLVMGMPTIFGESANLITAFRFIVDVFKYSEANSYNSIFGFLLGIGYFVTLILLLKQFVNVCSGFKGLKQSMYQSMPAIAEDGLTAYMSTAVMLVACAAFADHTVNLLTLIFLIAGFVTVTLANIAVRCNDHHRYHKYQNVFACVCLKDALYALIAGLLFAFMMRPFGRDAIYGFKMLFEGGIAFSEGFLDFLNSFYSNLLLHLAVFTMCVMIFINCAKMMGRAERLKGGLIVPLTISAVLISLQLLFNGLMCYDLNNFSLDVLVTWLHSIRLFLLPISLLLVGVFSVEVQFN